MRIFAFFLFFFFYSAVSAESHFLALSNAQMFNLGVKTGPLSRVDDIPPFMAKAVIKAPLEQQHIVSSGQKGLVDKLWVSPGNQIEKGQLLAQIKSGEFIELQKQFIQINKKRLTAWFALKKDRKLFNDGVISNTRLKKTTNHYNDLAEQTDILKQLLEVSGLSAEEIKKLGKTKKFFRSLKLYSPVAGVVIEQMKQAGQRAEQFDAIYKIVDLQKLWLSIEVNQKHFNFIKPGDQVILEALNLTSSIDLISQVADNRQQTFLARASLTEQLDNVLIGQRLDVKISHQNDGHFFKINQAAMAKHHGIDYIFKRTEKGFKLTPITIVQSIDEEAIINVDLEDGDEIAVRGAVALLAMWLNIEHDAIE